MLICRYFRFLGEKLKTRLFGNLKVTYDYEDPTLLLWFCMYVIQGSRYISDINDEQKNDKIEQSISIIAQHFVQACLINRSVTRAKIFVQNVRLLLQLCVVRPDQNCWFPTLHCAITYNSVLEIENAISTHVKENIINNGYYLPDSMTRNFFVWFVLYNIDFLEDTVSGNNTLHGTGIAMYQCQSTVTPKIPLLLKRPPYRNETNNMIAIDDKYCMIIDDKPKKKLDI